MMPCPKCNTRMHSINGTSIVSGLHNHGDTSTLMQGHSCYNCGTYVEQEIVPMQYEVVVRVVGRKKVDHSRLTYADVIVWSHRDLVRNMIRLEVRNEIILKHIRAIISSPRISDKSFLHSLDKFRTGRLKNRMVKGEEYDNE